MEQKYHAIVNQYGSMNFAIKYINLFSIEPGKHIEGAKTLPGVCGFVIPLSGKAQYEVNNSSYILDKQVVFHAGGSMPLSKKVLSDEPWKYILLHYQCTNEGCPLKQSLLCKHYSVPLTPKQHELVASIALEIWTLSKKSEKFLNLRLKTLFFQLVETIFIYSDAEESVCSIKDYIDRNFHKKISIEEFAEKFQMDTKSFSYQFKKEVGLSPKQYIMESRLNLAKELIEKGGYRISEISNKVGYDDALYFSRAFKKYVGKSPKQYEGS